MVRLFAILALLTPAAAPPADGLAIDVVTVSGTGCPAGTVSPALLPDNSGFQLTFAGFRAASGGGVPAAQAQRNCQLSLLLHIPAGYTYAIVQQDFAGTAGLQAGAGAALRTSYYYAGQAAQTFTHSFAGELDGSWQVTDVVDPAALVYQPCGADVWLNVSATLRANAGTVSNLTSWIALDESGSQAQAVYRFDWQECTAQR
jgi:uncharacterized protein DUF4360